MKIFRNTQALPVFKNATVTLGTFDGVHLGHMEIIKTLKEKAAAIEGETILVTFWPHPRMVLQPHDTSLQLLNTLEEKIAILEGAGIDNLLIIPFTLELAGMAHTDFIKKILVDTLHVKSLVIGHDHQFGKNREGNFEELEKAAPQYGFELTQVPALAINGLTVSSSKIRHALAQGDIGTANSYLGYEYTVTGTVVEGMKRGRELGFPTANIRPDETFKMLPAEGIYAVEAQHEGHWYQGMASLGYNPTFGDTGKTLEVNMFGFNQQIYNEKMSLKFWHFLRKEIKFANRKELVQQIHADESEARQFFINLLK